MRMPNLKNWNERERKNKADTTSGEQDKIKLGSANKCRQKM